MIEGSSYGVDPWCLRESGIRLEHLAQTESVFALSNGHIGVRGNLEEGEPHGLPGTYLNGFYESRPLPYAEAGYGYPEAGETVVDVTNGKILRLLVDDEPFDIRYGDLRSHERTLDFRAGVLRRSAEWESPGHRTVRVCSTRLVSLVQRAVMGISYTVTPLDGPAQLVLQSELVANEDMPVVEADPRVAAALDRPLRAVESHHFGPTVYLAHETRRSGLRLGAMMDHYFEGPSSVECSSESFDDLGRVSFVADLEPGQELRVVKLVSYGWSSTRSFASIRDQVAAALVGARHTGWEAMLGEQRSYLDEFWARSDVEVEGDQDIQQAVRFALFHILQAGARAEARAIPAKGLTGPGYDGHAFWDSESFVLPVLTYTVPEAAADALRWRHTTLPDATRRARQLGLEGAAFPWRTIAGAECSAYWPAGTAAFHVNADIADAVRRYVAASGDESFEANCGLDLLVATARLWASLGHFDGEGRFHIDGVTGPDEYSALADNNVFTNLMAKRNLLSAAELVQRRRANAGDVDDQELVTWRRAGENMVLVYDERLGVHPQAEGFTRHDPWDFAATRSEAYPLLLHFPYFDLYRRQVVKQADLVLALFFCGDEFADEDKIRDFEYYEPLTVRDSSLSASTQAVMAAETGHLDLAYDYWGEAALMDLDDLEHNTRDGLHIASLAGAWSVAVCGFGGMRDYAERLLFKPRLPSTLSRLAFHLYWRAGPLRVDIGTEGATYCRLGGEAVSFGHYDSTVRLSPGEERFLAIPPMPVRPSPSQPPGRAPLGRRGPAA